MVFLPTNVLKKILEYIDYRKERNQQAHLGKTMKVIDILRRLGSNTGLDFKRVAFIYSAALGEFGGRLFPSQDGRRLLYLPPNYKINQYASDDPNSAQVTPDECQN